MITNRFVRMLGIAVLTATSGAACSSSPTDEVAVQEGTGTTEEAISATGFGLSQFHTVLPNGFGGRAVAVTISPTNAGAALVATEGGGLFRTADGGASWTHIEATSGLVPFRMGDVRFDPSNANNVILTAAGDTHTVNAGGIWRSTDGGVHWQQPATAAPPCNSHASAYGIAYGPGTSNVYVGTSCGLAVSSDHGATWRHTNPTVTTTSVQSVVAQAGGIIDILGSDGHHRSRNSGSSWTATSTLPHGTVSDMLNLPNAVLHALSGAPTSTEVLFATIYDTDTVNVTGGTATLGGQIFESDNGGGSWTNISANLGSTNGNDYDANGRPPFVKTHASTDGDPTHFDIYWTDTAWLFSQKCTATSGLRCKSNGWTKYDNSTGRSIAHTDNADIDWAAGVPCPKLLVGDGGVQNTTDCSVSWHMVGAAWNSFNALQLYQVTGETLTGTSDYYFGTQDNNFYASTNAGSSWTAFGNEGRKIQVPHHANATSGTGQIVAFEYGGGQGWTTYNAASGVVNGWDNDNPGTNHQDPMDPNKQILTAPVVPGHVSPLVVSPGVYVEWSQPNGSNNSDLYVTRNTPPWTPPAYNTPWTKVVGTTLTMPRAGSAQLSGPATSPTLFQAVVRSNGTHGLVRITNILSGTPAINSIDAGLTDIGENGSFFDEWSWAVDPSDPQHLIAADIGQGQMMVTTNGGTNWTPDPRLTALVTAKGAFLFSQSALFFGQPRSVAQVSTIAFDPTNGKRVVVGTVAAGVLASLDGGQTWVSVPNTQQIGNITSFFFDERANDVLISSFGRGLWTMTMPAGGFCGSLLATACGASVSGSTAHYTSLQAAVNAAPNGATITATGVCKEHVSVTGRSNLTLQGTAPAGGCGTLGPSMTDLTSTVQGLDLVGSTGITVKYLNIADSTANGLLVSASAVVQSLNCNCIARSALDGLLVTAAAVNGATQNLIVTNLSGVNSTAATALAFSNNTIQSNRWEGVALLSTAAAAITGNVIQDNTVGGVILTTSSGNFVDSNTINGNGDGLTNVVTCAASIGNLGSNIPLLCL